MKKILSIIIVISMAMLSLCSCGSSDNTNKHKIKILTTIFPVYDWTVNIVGENNDIKTEMLLDNGVDLHSFQPTADDIINISTCDIFIYVGGESDKWVEDALRESTNKEMIVLNLMDILGNSAKEEELVEGMQTQEAEENEKEYDEHIWLSLKNAKILCKAIEQAVEKIDEANKNTYYENASAYIEKLDALDRQYEDCVNSADSKTILFGDRFPFRYLVDDYSIKYFAAFAGCSAESEASFETISFLAKKVDELGLSTILTTESNNNKIAKTIVSATKDKTAKILSMNSMQSITKNDVDGGATYLGIMEENLAVLKQTLK